MRVNQEEQRIFSNFQVKMQGFMHFIAKKLFVAKNRDRAGG